MNALDMRGSRRGLRYSGGVHCHAKLLIAPQRLKRDRVLCVARASAPAIQDDLLLTKQMNFIATTTLPCGMLTVRALRPEWIQATADLLADVFVAVRGGAFPTYRNYLRRQISIYLEQHIRMPPKAIVIQAILTLDSSHPLAAEAAASTDSTTPSAPHASVSGRKPRDSTGSSNGGAVTAVAHVESRYSGGSHTSNGSGGSTSLSSNGNGTGTSSSEPHRENDNEITEGTNSSAAESGHGNGSVHATQHDSSSQQFNSNSSHGTSLHSDSSVNSSEHDSSSGGGSWEADGQCSSYEEVACMEGGVKEVLVGVAEVSFSPKTRSSYLTLNPPARCAYLCNMAVSPGFRRLGIASELLAAAEQLSRDSGEQEMFLHLRFQDKPAAELYRSSGFTAAKQDMFWIKWLGMDQRYLMRKQL